MRLQCLALLGFVVLVIPTRPNRAADKLPHATDERLVIELFAQEPDIVTPTGLAVDRRNRVFVAESHTHFRPDGYDGPKADRILVFEDTDGDGKSDKRTIFHEGFTHIMDIEFAADGSLYVATRMDIHRMRDIDADGRADSVTPVIKMETEGNYPHNGLSGLAFDFRGGLNFGLGENLGKSYTLVGSDGIRIGGGGEGGSTYYCEPDGSKLRRTSTGWWNPFGMCVDAFGRIFGTDNDPDSSPPCRLIQVVPGGDYGYEFRYGRTGLHPLTTWNGTLPGTLPMISGTGEAPCAMVAYESDGLPAEYRGQLLVPSWADHRIERFPLHETLGSGLVETRREVLIEGPDDFRPVGIDVAPDGSVFVSDWVSSSYTLHKLGRVWRIRAKEMPAQNRSQSPAEAVTSFDRFTREAAAHALSRTPNGLDVLRRIARSHDAASVRAAAILGLTAARAEFDYLHVAKNDANYAVRSLAVRAAIDLGEDARGAFSGESKTPNSVQAELNRQLDPSVPADLERLLAASRSTDPYLRHSAIESLARIASPSAELFARIYAREPLAGLLAWKRNPSARAQVTASDWKRFLASPSAEVQLATVKWIADDMRKDGRDALNAVLNDGQLDVPRFLAIMAAIDRLDGKPISDRPSPDTMLTRLRADQTPAELRRILLRLLDPAHPKLRIADLTALATANDAVGLEAIRTLAAHPANERLAYLKQVALDTARPAPLRAAAVAGLASVADTEKETLVQLAEDKHESVRDEALRSLVGVQLPAELRARLESLAKGKTSLAPSVRRILQGDPGPRPSREDTSAWLVLAGGSSNSGQSGDRASGERLFFGTKVGTCARCHQFEGRGNSVGPDLSRIRERFQTKAADRNWLLETILVPGKQMAPQFTPWVIQLKDGRTLTGLPRRKGGNSEAYLGDNGKEFVVKNDEIEFHHEAKTSIMPHDLLNALTPSELADLLAFLEGT